MKDTMRILWMIFALFLCFRLYQLQTKQYKIELTYYDNSSELLIYDELPYIISTDSTTFCVIDSESKICGVKQFKIHK